MRGKKDVRYIASRLKDPNDLEGERERIGWYPYLELAKSRAVRIGPGTFVDAGWGKEAQIFIEHWRREYDHLRPHSSLGGRPPAPEAIAWPDFSLKDFAPPTFTREPALALS